MYICLVSIKFFSHARYTEKKTFQRKKAQHHTTSDFYIKTPAIAIYVVGSVQAHCVTRPREDLLAVFEESAMMDHRPKSPSTFAQSWR
jgi:hypothetical protein